jgi:hypothetical protein
MKTAIKLQQEILTPARPPQRPPPLPVRAPPPLPIEARPTPAQNRRPQKISNYGLHTENARYERFSRDFLITLLIWEARGVLMTIEEINPAAEYHKLTAGLFWLGLPMIFLTMITARLYSRESNISSLLVILVPGMFVIQLSTYFLTWKWWDNWSRNCISGSNFFACDEMNLEGRIAIAVSAVGLIIWLNYRVIRAWAASNLPVYPEPVVPRQQQQPARPVKIHNIMD